MRIITKEKIKSTLENPLGFILLFLLIILALSNSFLVGCLIAAIAQIIITLLNLIKPDFIEFNPIDRFCDSSSWKMKGIDIFTKILGEYTLLIIFIGFILWALLNHTNKGKDILSLLD